MRAYCKYALYLLGASRSREKAISLLVSSSADRSLHLQEMRFLEGKSMKSNLLLWEDDEFTQGWHFGLISKRSQS